MAVVDKINVSVWDAVITKFDLISPTFSTSACTAGDNDNNLICEVVEAPNDDTEFDVTDVVLDIISETNSNSQLLERNEHNYA